MSFLASGMPVNERDDDTGDTLLHNACKGDMIDTCKVLVSIGKANVNARNMYTQETPLHCAGFFGAPRCAKYILTHGGDPNVCDMGGWTPLAWAAVRGNYKAAKVLVKHGASIYRASERIKLIKILKDAHAKTDRHFHRRMLPKGPFLNVPFTRIGGMGPAKAAAHLNGTATHGSDRQEVMNPVTWAKQQYYGRTKRDIRIDRMRPNPPNRRKTFKLLAKWARKERKKIKGARQREAIKEGLKAQRILEEMQEKEAQRRREEVERMEKAARDMAERAKRRAEIQAEREAEYMRAKDAAFGVWRRRGPLYWRREHTAEATKAMSENTMLMAHNLLKKIQQVQMVQAEAAADDRESSMMRALKRTLGGKKKKKKKTTKKRSPNGKVAVGGVIAEEDDEDYDDGAGVEAPDAMASRRRRVPGGADVLVIEDID